MSKVSMSTGDILFSGKKSGDRAPSTAPAPPKSSSGNSGPMHIALVADFSGRGSRGEKDLAGLSERKAWWVDRDNMEELFSQFGVKIKLPVNDDVLHFSEFDELHPDFLYENLSLFADLRSLKRRLNKTDHFAKAAEEIQQWASFTQDTSSSEPEATSSAQQQAQPLPTDLFDAILTGSDTSKYQQSPEGEIHSLIKDIVAPYVQPKADPRLPEYLAAVDEATSHTMRRVLHADAYQHVESAWRCVDFLTRRLETNNKLKIVLVDVSREEIYEDISANKTIEETALYKLLAEKHQVSGSTPYSLINVDLTLSDREEDVRLASALAHIGQAAKAAVIAGAATKLAGCANIFEAEDVDDWEHELDSDVAAAWQAMREQEAAAHLAVCAPRFLVRMPYGERSSPIESFDFEELPENNPHPYYLWANSAYLVTYLLALSYSQSGWEFSPGQQQKVENLPMHIYTEDDESKAKACAEIFMRDRAATQLASVGILAVRSVANEASVIVPSFRSVSSQGSMLFQWA